MLCYPFLLVVLTSAFDLHWHYLALLFVIIGNRTTRESTPCSLIRDPDIIRTPGSTTRPTCSTEANRRSETSRRHIPTAREMDEFFSDAEEAQQKRFVEKYAFILYILCFLLSIQVYSIYMNWHIACGFNCRYNYDPVNDKPLPGRYEWEKLKP